MTQTESAQLRLQVFLSRQGVCSRRKAMELVQSGRVTVNGQVITEPSFAVVPGKDAVTVNGKKVRTVGFEYILMNKPAGITTTRADRFAEKTVLDMLPREFKHLNPVGRLDKDTEGLLLFTNDGDLANRLTHPSFSVDKTYLVKISGQLKKEEQSRLEKGVLIAGQKTSPAKISNVETRQTGTEFLMVIHEGRKRQIRLMLRAVRHEVTYLKRLRQGTLFLGDLPAGQFRKLTGEEIRTLKGLS